ncbi:NAD-dependent epimerase/dehydratase family protein [Chamaesiphon sp.]|uniref:NAD-dependent epimerase/dehydratase family protein n=1 Tax=Chamaesiphon sp. TaxID=2814140 RepID=UPI0035940FC4
MTKQIKKVLVTGGAGFIGSATIAAFQNDGHEIYAIDNLSFGNRKFITIPESHFFEIDILDRAKLFRVISQIEPDWIIHLAAIHFIPYCNQHPIEAARVNIQGTINVLDAARNVPNLEKVFFASTAAVYPIYNDAISETHPPAPTDIYGLSKLTGEHLMNEFHLQTDVPTIVCRFFNAFGPNETNAHVIPEIQRQINAGCRTIQLGNLDPKRDFIHTSDMASAIVKLLDIGDRGIEIFNLGRGIEYSVTEVVTAFEQALGERIVIEVDPARVRKVERMHLLADITKLKNFIDWEPKINLNQGISTLIKCQPITK